MILINKLEVSRLSEAVLGTGDTKNLNSRFPLVDWNMERDDAPILTRIIHWAKPRRHLEFGTWKGYGTCLVLENSDAVVWTINLPEGELKPDGTWAYSERREPKSSPNPGIPSVSFGRDENGEQIYQQTDAGPSIGHLYRERGLGHRVNQIYCDSRLWETSAYPKNFFDTIFVDGGHQSNVVASDTKKALSLLRPGGLILWHDFCPDEAVKNKYPHVVSVMKGVESVSEELVKENIELYWIDPSWLLLGLKKA